MTGVKGKHSPAALSDQLQHSGREVNNFPGMRGLTLDQHARILTSTNMTWGSTATKTSRAFVPYNYTIKDIFRHMTTAPVSTGSKKFRVGTTTDDDLHFVTGNFKFASGDTTGFSRMTTATNFILATGNAGMVLQFKLPPTAAVVSNGGSMYFGVVLVPR